MSAAESAVLAHKLRETEAIVNTLTDILTHCDRALDVASRVGDNGDANKHLNELRQIINIVRLSKDDVLLHVDDEAHHAVELKSRYEQQMNQMNQLLEKRNGDMTKLKSELNDVKLDNKRLLKLVKEVDEKRSETLKTNKRLEEENILLQEAQTQDRARLRDVLRRNQELEEEKHALFERVQNDMSSYEAELVKFESMIHVGNDASLKQSKQMTSKSKVPR